MLRSTTNIAYGFIDETPTVQALRWNDMKLIITGILKQLTMPLEGWTEFWRRVSLEFDIRLNQRIAHVDRTANGVTLTTANGLTETFDEIVCAIPLDEFAKITEPTEDEKYVASSVIWNGYTTTLVAVDNWFNDVHVEAYLDSVLPGAARGQLLSARYEGGGDDFGGDLYLTGQLSGDYTGPELQELLRTDITKYGGTVTACGLAQDMDFPSSVAPFILRGVTLKGIDSVMAPLTLRKQAWSRLAKDLDLDKLASLSRTIDLNQAIGVAGEIMSGTNTGRVVVKI